MASCNSSIPHEYLCPITHDIMKNPVILIEDGCTYEESALQSWLKNHNTSPITNKQLTNRNYIPNRALKSLIDDFIQKQISSRNLDEFFTFRICSGKHHNPDWQDRPTIRIILSLLGASGVGKTILSQALQYGRLPENLKHCPSTIGIDIQFYYLDKLFRNEYVVIIQLNDPPGQEKFESATNHFFRQCHGVLLLTDTTRINTLERLEQYWYVKLEKLALNNVQTVLICTKTDLFEKETEDYRRLFIQQAEKFAFLHQMPIVQVSAYRGDNVEHIFKQLIIRIMEDQTLVNDLISKSSRPDDSIKRRKNALKTVNIIASESDEEMNKNGSKCCR